MPDGSPVRLPLRLARFGHAASGSRHAHHDAYVSLHQHAFWRERENSKLSLASFSSVQENGVPQIRSGTAELASAQTNNTIYSCSYFGTSQSGVLCKNPTQNPIPFGLYSNGLAPAGWVGDPVPSTKRAMRRGTRAEVATPDVS